MAYDMKKLSEALGDMELSLTDKSKQEIMDKFKAFSDAQVRGSVSSQEGDYLDTIPLIKVPVIEVPKNDMISEFVNPLHAKTVSSPNLLYKQTDRERRELIVGLAAMNQTALQTIYDNLTKPENRAEVQRLLNNKVHREDLNKMLVLGAKIAKTPGKVDDETVKEMVALALDKQRTFTHARWQMVITFLVTTTGIAMLAKEIAGLAAAAGAGLAIKAFFTSIGAGLKTFGVLAAANKAWTSLAVVSTVALGAMGYGLHLRYGVFNKYNDPDGSLRTAAKTAKDLAASEKASEANKQKGLSGQKTAEDKLEAASIALTKGIKAYTDKIEGKTYAAAANKTIRGAGKAARGAVNFASEKVSKTARETFDAVVPEGNQAKLDAALNAPRNMAKGAGQAGVGAYKAVAGAYKAAFEKKRDKKEGKSKMLADIEYTLKVLSKTFSEKMAEIVVNLDGKGRAAANRISKNVEHGLKVAADAMQDAPKNLSKLSAQVSYDLSILGEALKQGTYSMAESASKTKEQLLKQLSELGPYLLKGVTDLTKKLGIYAKETMVKMKEGVDLVRNTKVEFTDRRDKKETGAGVGNPLLEDKTWRDTGGNHEDDLGSPPRSTT